MKRNRRRLAPAPPGLSAEARRLWRDTVSAFVIVDRHDLTLLDIMCRSLDRQRQAEKLLAVEGLTYVDRFSQRKPHPGAAIVRDAAQTYMKALAALGLNLGPPQSKEG